MEDHGNGVRSYESLDEMFSDQRNNEESANAGVLDLQREISWDSHAISIDHRSGIVIFGYIPSLEQNLAAEDIHSPEEIAEARERFKASYAANYRYGQWFSAVLPEGEMGTKHIVTLWPITQEEFNEAEANGWDLPDERLMAIQRESDEAAIAEGKLSPEAIGEMELMSRVFKNIAICWDGAGDDAVARVWNGALISLGLAMMDIEPTDENIDGLRVQIEEFLQNTRKFHE